MPRDPTAFDSLATPVAWLDGSLRLMGANPAFGRWLGVGLRRLPGVPLDALEADGDVLHRLVARPPADDGAVRLQRLPVAFPGQGAVRFADITLSPDADGWLLEAHPVAEFPGEDPAQALPGALSAALRGVPMTRARVDIFAIHFYIAKEMNAPEKPITAENTSKAPRSRSRPFCAKMLSTPKTLSTT